MTSTLLYYLGDIGLKIPMLGAALLALDIAQLSYVSEDIFIRILQESL